ncbi:TIGR02594 family protein [Methylobacterium hispanicum]|uniref:NlpC/P60 family protein n=1 Tax=Methylobacterium hispanicum TaxID=270350 RepID=UPI002F2E9932
MDVAEIQRALIARGYDLGPAGADGDAGPKTIAAVTAFQRSAGLVADGIAGPLTVKALQGADVSERRAEPEQPAWLTLASHDLGTVEGIGKANNPKVVAYFKDAGFAGVKDDATAWCAAFVNAMLERAGRRGSRSLAARSFEGWGIGLKEPALGCIATKKRGNSTWQGHTGFVVGANKDQIFLLGGNQGDKVSVAAFKRSEFTAFRWPADVPLPVASKLPTSIAGARSGVSEA